MKQEIDQNGVTARITQLIDESLMTKSGFAVKVKIDAGNFSKKMDGKDGQKWTARDINRICTFTNVDSDWLMFGIGDRKRIEFLFQESDADNSSREDVAVIQNADSINVREEIIRLTIRMTENENIIGQKQKENDTIMKKLNALCALLKGE